MDHFSNIFSKTKRLKQIDYKKGFSSSIRTTQRFLKRKYDLISEDYDNKLKMENNVIWFDNYSKYYKISRPSYYFLLLLSFLLINNF